MTIFNTSAVLLLSSVHLTNSGTTRCLFFAESNGPLGSVQRAADAIRDSTSKDAEPNALRNVRLALLSLPRDSSNVPDVPEVRIEYSTLSSYRVCFTFTYHNAK